MGLRRRSYLSPPLDWLGCALARMLYRVRGEGTEHLPASGGAVLIANHLSYADVAALQLASPRPLRFLAYRGPELNDLFGAVIRAAGAIVVEPSRPEAAVRRAIRSARAGELVCLFAEGQISRTGQLMGLERGYQVIARQAGVPVIPAAIDGLWGSVYSFSGGRYLWKRPRIRRMAVSVVFGTPLAPREADPAAARRALLELGARAFEARPSLRGHVGREAVRAMARRPGRVVLVDRTAAPRKITSARALAAAAALGRRWRRTIGEPRVGLALPPGAGALVANLAVHCAGKVPVNLNFTAGRESVAASLRQSGIRTVIGADALRVRFADFPWPEDTRDLPDEIRAAGGKRALLPWLALAWLLPGGWLADAMGLPRRGDRTEAALLFTSGSTGLPKGVPLTHRNLLANCEQISSTDILPPSAVLLGCVPLFHAFGLTATLWYPLLRKCGLVTVPSPLETRRLIDAIAEERVTVLIAPPTFLRPILRKAEPRELRSLEIVVAGAERLPEDVYRGFLERFDLEVLQGYGLTESSPVAAVNQPDPPVTTGTASPQAGGREGTVGRLMPGIAARITDPDTGRELDAGEPGQLWLKGANVFGGYLGPAGGDALRDGWFRTGDIGRFDEEGFLTIAGRLSRFSKLGGEMVPHGRIEEALAAGFGADPSQDPVFVVVGVPDAAKGEALTLITTREVSSEEVRGRLSAAGLPNLWIPKAVLRVDRIPTLGAGKVDLRACGELAKEGRSG
ncbi:MAG: AMP-binding protein [Opitutaceae bacterium]